MSSRGQLVGAAPKPATYMPASLPALAEDLPVYLEEELEKIAAHIGSIVMGRAFQPQSELPTKLKEGQTVFFIGAIPDSTVISKGLWVFYDDTWHKCG